jgi:hypothetical protein
MAVLAVGLAVEIGLGAVGSAIAAAVFVGIGSAFLLSLGRGRIAVVDRTLFAGPARLPARFFGGVSALDPANTRRVLGRDADPAAFRFVRWYVPGSVVVQVVDPADDTPYWVVSSRRPDELAEALTVARAAAAQPSG